MLGGTSAEKALKEIDPIVDQINAFFEEYKSLSNDQLRGKTADRKSTRLNSSHSSVSRMPSSA